MAEQRPIRKSLRLVGFIFLHCLYSSRGGLNQWNLKDKAEPSSLLGNEHTSSPFRSRERQALLHIRRSMILQLVDMAQWAKDPTARTCLESILACVQQRFSIISELASTARIRPFSRIVLTEGDPSEAIEERPLRIGVYPLAANPLHWGHILVGLTAVASLSLDKVIYLIAGRDTRKPFLLPEETRHQLGRSVIESFHPLFAYSPLALGTDLDGETNLGRFLSLNLHQPMEVFYIAGADHYRRTSAQGEPDTIEKLERFVEGQRKTPARHSISVAFMGRSNAKVQRRKVKTTLDVYALPAIPFSFSSTAARKALCREGFSEPLVSLPYSCLLEIRTEGLYVSKGECIEDLADPR
jgi:nicotinic acid mononucleotide adenylyltransferase